LWRRTRASLTYVFYTGDQFPSEYKGDIFAAFHVHEPLETYWLQIVRVPFDKSTGKPRGEYEDFVTGYVTPDGKSMGRPSELPSRKWHPAYQRRRRQDIWRVSYGR